MVNPSSKVSELTANQRIALILHMVSAKLITEACRRGEIGFEEGKKLVEDSEKAFLQTV